METDKKIINVVAAVIYDNVNTPKKIFAAQKGYGEFKGGWEFPVGLCTNFYLNLRCNL